MYRYGHTGIVLIVYAPFAYVFLRTGQPALAILCGLGLLAIEPLPDRDFRLPFLSHRGISHSLFAALLIGLVMGAIGWFVGRHAISPIVQALQELSITRLTDSEDILRDLRVYDAEAFSLIGFTIGVFGVTAHLLGDMITTSGIRPFLPFSHRRVSLSSIHSDNIVANSALFVLGVLAITIVVITAIPNVVFIPATFGYSPADVAAGQPQTQPNATVEISNQTSNGSIVTIRRATLPEGGFIIVYNESYRRTGDPLTSAVGLSGYLPPGNHSNVTLDVLPSALNRSQTVTVRPAMDTNDNQRYDYVRSNGSQDVGYSARNRSSTVAATAQVRILGGTNTTQTANQSPNTTATPNANTTTNQSRNATSLNATAVFANQTVNGSTVTVREVTLPSPGFVVLDSTGSGEEGVIEESTIAVSDRLSAGTHRNVSIRVNQSPPGGVANRSALNSTGTYQTVLYRDSNTNSRFEFITSGRSADRPFIMGENNTSLALDNARIIVRGSRGDPNATPTPTASIEVGDQRTNGSAVTMRSVTLPQGGFIVVHNESYDQPGVSPLRTVIGVSSYLSDGTHHNVSIGLSHPIRQSQTVVLLPSRDTNANKTYDYVSSDGFHDVPYTAGGEIVSGRASVSALNGSTTAVSSTSTTGALSTTSSATSPSTSTSDTELTTTGQSAASNTTESESGGVGTWLLSNILIVGVVVVAILVVLPTLVRRL